MIFGIRDNERARIIRDALKEAPLWMAWSSRQLVLWKYNGTLPDGLHVFTQRGASKGVRRARRIVISTTQMYQNWERGLLWPAIVQGGKGDANF